MKRYRCEVWGMLDENNTTTGRYIYDTSTRSWFIAGTEALAAFEERWEGRSMQFVSMDIKPIKADRKKRK